ncbi:GyrI-like domain-containing protein [Lapidilactobacillus mulanensis]|uniref:GyrI-like domain-containing protein n=1 Tax=Lapidilactobacillus mulanensis TaxID=2485999 RepID=A0ABW4DPW3_9LACO|nr:GyrI-like domain-containing protein [Lapidilactobacillus mulanensis]
MEKTNWRQDEKEIYPLKKTPSITTLPKQNFITITGQGDPNGPEFASKISALYPIAYAIRMAPKKGIEFPGAFEYTVYPLEGFWTLAEGHREGPLDKDYLQYKIMIKQPSFVDRSVFDRAIELAHDKVAPELLSQVKFERFDEGLVGMIMHVGSFDDEPASFAQLADFLATSGYQRTSKEHKEIYISDFRRVPEEKRKTILRVSIEKIK